jgi:hypothetical protein
LSPFCNHEPSIAGLYSAVSLDSGSAQEATETKLKEYKLKQVVPLIMATSEAEFETLWAKFVDGYKSMNPQEVVNTYNEKYNGLKSKFDGLTPQASSRNSMISSQKIFL